MTIQNVYIRISLNTSFLCFLCNEARSPMGYKDIVLNLRFH